MAAISLPTTSLWLTAGAGVAASLTIRLARDASWPSGRRTDAEDGGDLAERHTETVMQYEGHPLIGVEPFQYHHRGESGVLMCHDFVERIGAV